MNGSTYEEMRQILGRVRREEFVGRTAQLNRLVACAMQAHQSRGLLILSTPLGGVSELLRQAYDQLFNVRSSAVPIYYALPQGDATAVSAAIEFLNTFLLQYIAFRRDEPSLCHISLTLNELVQLAPTTDLDWIEDLINDYNQKRFADDDRELVRLCLTAPRRVPASIGLAFVMFDAGQLKIDADSDVALPTEIVRSLTFCGQPFALAGLRRQILGTVERAGGNTDCVDQLHLERLTDEDARTLVVSTAERLQVRINEQTRDLLVQQLGGSPFVITSILKAAHEKHLALDSYFACERLYVDELLGGRLNRYFTFVIERIASEPETRRAVVNLLCEAVPAGRRTSSFEAWRKRLALEPEEVEALVSQLHAEELINWDGETIDVEGGPIPWRDYLRTRFRLDALREPRALVVGDLMAEALKRAPQTIAHHYRRVANLRLRELLDRFNFQLVPRRLFYYDQFAQNYKGAPLEEIVTQLEANTDLIRLPQVFHTASGVSLSPELRRFGEEVSVVAHAFDGASYTDASEVVWLVARVDSKLEVDRSLIEAWCDRLERLARSAGFVRTQLWLISNEGFSAEASDVLRQRAAFSSNQQQVEILMARLGESEGALIPSSSGDEIELILPMGSDYELLAANTVEQVARRLKFRPEAINQIKTAIVEACINASEHSLSPDRKIYQRFRVENDKLVITIASRGIVPSNLNAADEQSTGGGIDDVIEQRRGWGLKLIKTLMDEVEFDRVDEGTSLRMTKYVRNSAS
jgi:serine/threonine-protein kinase RsbW